MSVTLNNGVEMPKFGLGTWLSPYEETSNAVKWALQAGYKHIDTATIYGNEQAVGDGIIQSGVKRSDIFVTTKLWNNMHKPEDVPIALERSLKALKMDYIDLWLMHYPCANDRYLYENEKKYLPIDVDFCDTWKAMEEALESGKVRAIGISNFSKAEVEKLLANCRIKPQMHQMEMHPYLQQNEFLQFHKDNDIHVTAYSSFGNQNGVYSSSEPKLFEHPKVVEVAKKNNTTVGNVLIAWAMKRGTIVIPKSVRKERIEENLQAKDFELSDEDFKYLSDFGYKKRYGDYGHVVGYWYYKDLECPGKEPDWSIF